MYVIYITFTFWGEKRVMLQIFVGPERDYYENH